MGEGSTIRPAITESENSDGLNTQNCNENSISLVGHDVADCVMVILPDEGQKDSVNLSVNANKIAEGENSISLVDQTVLDCVIVIRSDTQNKDSVNLSANANTIAEGEKGAFVIDVKHGDGESFGEKIGGEKLCRICHLSSTQTQEKAGTSDATGDSAGSVTEDELIQLGCGCKDDLGTAHPYCAEAWFRVRGNRVCEICGETAKNITGHMEPRFVREWAEMRFNHGNAFSSGRGRECCRRQPICNILMASLIIAFVLPWFFHIDLL